MSKDVVRGGVSEGRSRACERERGRRGTARKTRATTGVDGGEAWGTLIWRQVGLVNFQLAIPTPRLPAEHKLRIRY